MRGAHLAAPEPMQGTLLPCSESQWNNGEIGSNEPLFASSFSPTAAIGSFASICQASHVLGLVLRHRSERSIRNIDLLLRLSEARRLHLTLLALNTHVAQKSFETANERSFNVAAAFCFCARIILYGMYACNEDYDLNGVRLAEESEIQRTFLEGMKDVTRGVYQLSQRILQTVQKADQPSLSTGLLICHALYLAASECAWFIQEDNTFEGIAGLKAMIELLRAIGSKWLVASEL